MSIQRDEITIKEFTSGTTLMYFSTHLDVVQDDTLNFVPTIIQFDNINNPVDATTFNGVSLWKRNSDNIHVPLSSLTNNYMTGHSYVIDEARIIEGTRLQIVKDKFTDSITGALINLITGLTEDNEGIIPGQSITVPAHTEFVFPSYHEIDDFYVNIKLNRTFATLDTLNIYNNLTNSIPTQEANTGVVFGRLMALQTIKDSEGNNIRIPLRNTPIGIFNASDDYPLSSSVTDDGDRLFLNIKESVVENEYFNEESFNFDKNELLRSASQFTQVPDQYKYITTTNDEGEFVIYDAPIGSQIAVFEVDLLKQGLTRDEIALNFFGFPPDSDAVLDQIPNFSFKQFPVNVVPAWGTIQTGYTELNITVNMDLRKWTTYFFPPVSVYAERLEASVAQNAGNSFKIQVRNMAKDGYPATNIKLAEIPNDLDRVFQQQLNWHLEFPQVKNRAEFFKFGCPIIKLPANIYDPEAFRTDSDGVPTSHKGVWLSSYQLKIFSDASGQGGERTTGSIRGWNGSDFFTKSHFNVNYSAVVPNTSPEPAVGAGIGQFPYEKPWSATYPNQYSIPRKPTDIRYQYSSERTPTSTPGVFYLDEPAYNDGDLIGLEVIASANNNNAGGFGSQSAFGVWVHNRIAESVTKNFMYKYESGVAWNEKYANGYEPSNPGYLRFTGASSVVGGEKYQRFESGYGYFMKPGGWPRIVRATWGGDTYFGPDIFFGDGLGGDVESPGPGTTTSVVSGGIWASQPNVNDVYNLNNIDLALVVDNQSLIKKGTLEAYRIVDSNPDNLALPENFVLPTFIWLSDGTSPARCYNFSLTNTGEIPVTIAHTFRDAVQTPQGIISSGSYTLEPGQSVSVPNPADVSGAPSPQDTVGWVNHKLPGNANYDPATNRYTSAKYQLRIVYNGDTNGSSIKYYNINKTASVSPDQWYIKTNHTGGVSGRISLGINTDHGGDPDKEVWNIALEGDNSSYDI